MPPGLASLQVPPDSFLGHRLGANSSYGFLPHYLYFAENQDRWPGSAAIQKKIFAPVSENPEKAWKEWREFRSAQAEVTALYLVEKLLGMRVNALEVSKAGYTKSCDIRASFDGQTDSYLEVKAQSGQQHGSLHPLCHGANLFDPRDEGDLMSWLFQQTMSKKTGKPMIPLCTNASQKGADVLIAMIDIMQFNTNGLYELGQTLVPDFLSEPSKFIRPFLEGGDLTVLSFKAGELTTKSMGTLREIWLFNESKLDDLLVIHAFGRPHVLSRSYS